METRETTGRRRRALWILPPGLLALALAGFLVDPGRREPEAAAVTELTRLVARLHAACRRHHLDTGRFAHEYTGWSHLKRRHHELAMPQSYPGWNGPYLAEPLGYGDHPWRGDLHLFNYLLVQGVGGFDLDGDGHEEEVDQRHACVLWMNEVPPEAAQVVDTRLDATSSGSRDWRRAGRLRYREKDRSLWILVHHADDP